MLCYWQEQFPAIWQGKRPLAKNMPLAQLVVLSGFHHIAQHLIVQGTGAPLQIGGGQQADQVIPQCLVFCRKVLLSELFQVMDCIVKECL